MVVKYEIQGDGITEQAMIIAQKVLEGFDVKNLTCKQIKDDTLMPKQDFFKMIDQRRQGKKIKLSPEEMSNFLDEKISHII